MVVSLAGLGFVAAGVWARREVQAGLARERIVTGFTPSPVTTGPAARALAEEIRSSTLAAADGRTYAETETDSDAHTLWIQSTTLQTALMQAYMGSRLADLTIGLGAAFLAVGAGLSAVARR